MLRKRVKFFKNKKADAVLSWLIESMPKIVLFIIVFGLIMTTWYNYSLFGRKPQPERDLKRIADEIRDIRDMPSTIVVPVFGQDYDLQFYPAGNSQEPRCNKKTCLCAYNTAQDMAIIGCEIIETLYKPGEGNYAVRSSKTIGKQGTTGEPKVKEPHIVTITATAEHSIRIS